jgi:truncated hemoglobin YjbI
MEQAYAAIGAAGFERLVAAFYRRVPYVRAWAEAQVAS